MAIESLDNINKDLQSSTDAIRSISSLPKNIEQKAMDSAMKNPPKELVNVPPEKYGKYTNVILADYSITHAKEISAEIGNPYDQKKFKDAIDSVKDVLGRGPVNWPDIVDARKG